MHSSWNADFAAFDKLPPRIRDIMRNMPTDFSAEQALEIFHGPCESNVSEMVWQLEMNSKEYMKGYKDVLRNPRPLQFDEAGLPVYS